MKTNTNNNLFDLTDLIKEVNTKRNLNECKEAVKTLFTSSRLSPNRKKGKEFSPLDAALTTADKMTNIGKLQMFAFNTVMKGEGLGVL